MKFWIWATVFFLSLVTMATGWIMERPLLIAGGATVAYIDCAIAFFAGVSFVMGIGEECEENTL